MPIIKAVVAPNGANVSFHKVMQFTANPGAGVVSVNVASWSTQADCNAGVGLVWMWPVDLPMSAVNGIDSALAITAPFDGGTVVGDTSNSLESQKLLRIAALTDAYNSAIAIPVNYTTVAGVAQVFQADPLAIKDVVASMLGCQAAQATPSGFFWNALDNTHVPFSYADLQGLAAAIFAQGAAAFIKLQQLKDQVRAATTSDQLGAITWVPGS